jgi:hypothetical protein
VKFLIDESVASVATSVIGIPIFRSMDARCCLVLRESTWGCCSCGLFIENTQVLVGRLRHRHGICFVTIDDGKRLRLS